MNNPLKQNPPFQIKPQAVLAAILFNLGETQKVKVKPDDSDKEIEVEAQIVGVRKKGDALVCVIPLERVFHYATVPYTAQTIIQDGFLVATFEKQKPAAKLFAANGQQLPQQSPEIRELMGLLNGESDA